MSRAERAEKTDLAQRSQRAPSLSLRSRRPPREIRILGAIRVLRNGSYSWRGLEFIWPGPESYAFRNDAATRGQPAKRPPSAGLA
jgi:hypothetical protein